jgi:hypothetical protein
VIGEAEPVGLSQFVEVAKDVWGCLVVVGDPGIEG